MSDVVRLAKKAKLPPYMWDTTEGLAALARFMDLARASLRGEPLAWMYKTVIHCGQGQFYDSDWKVSLHKPPDSAVCVTPLYAAPQGIQCKHGLAGPPAASAPVKK